MTIINKKTVITSACVASIFLAISINGALSANQERTPPPKAPVQYPQVSVSTVQSTSHRATISAYGEVTSRNKLSLTSQVSGKVVTLAPNFLSGKVFKQGEVIASLETIEYQQAVANAMASLADAELALAQEELNAKQAEAEWQQSGLADHQASDLVLRKPQLAAAKAKFELAKQSLEKAEYDLSQTKITAPFDALIVSKAIQVGSNVQAGSEIAVIYDISLFEVALPLSTAQWQSLNQGDESAYAHSAITLSDDANNLQWSATFNRVEQHINANSRQRALIVNVSNPLALSTPLFPGTFVKATVEGTTVDNLWKLPASALIDNHTVWQISNEDLLRPLSIDVVFSQDNAVYVRPKAQISQAKIVNRPLASYLTNMKVVPQLEEVL
ncbi:MAG: efflux RND transporter periplasmic adaptor subunit [Psychrobium sp.]